MLIYFILGIVVISIIIYLLNRGKKNNEKLNSYQEKCENGCGSDPNCINGKWDVSVGGHCMYPVRKKDDYQFETGKEYSLSSNITNFGGQVESEEECIKTCTDSPSYCVAGSYDKTDKTCRVGTVEFTQNACKYVETNSNPEAVFFKSKILCN